MSLQDFISEKAASGNLTRMGGSTHWRAQGNAQRSPESEPTVVLPEEFRGNTKIQPSVPEVQSGRIRPSGRQYRDRYPQAEAIDGWKQPTYPKAVEPTLESLQLDLANVELAFNEAGERYANDKDQPDTRISDTTAEIEALKAKLAEKLQQLADLQAEGNCFDKISRAIDRAEKQISGIANSTLVAAVNVDAVRVFEVEAKFLPKATLDALKVKHEMKLRQYLPQVFIQLSGKTLDVAAIDKNGERLMNAIEAVKSYLSKLISKKGA